MTDRADLLIHQLDIAWALFEYHLADLDDEAFLWEPAEPCWTVHQTVGDRWTADWADTEPDPVPAVTIAWVSWHIGYWWTTTLGHCFGEGAPAREDISWPGSAAGTVAWLRGLKDEWRTRLAGLTDADLDSTDRTASLPWGGDQTLAAVAAWLNVELTKNVAEIGLLHGLRRLSGARAAG